jgi:tetratricopeptide (TPR) repeat protein
LGKWLKSLRTATVRKGYDYWVASALAEEDRQAKVRYLSKALQLNPAYHPAWGMKGNALFELGKYDDAIECFDKSLELHPSALVWYRKGLCCYHKGRREESLQCFGKALKECPAHDRPLVEDVTRMKRLVEEELRCAKAT